MVATTWISLPSLLPPLSLSLSLCMRIVCACGSGTRPARSRTLLSPQTNAECRKHPHPLQPPPRCRTTVPAAARSMQLQPSGTGSSTRCVIFIATQALMVTWIRYDRTDSRSSCTAVAHTLGHTVRPTDAAAAAACLPAVASLHIPHSHFTVLAPRSGPSRICAKSSTAGGPAGFRPNLSWACL